MQKVKSSLLRRRSVIFMSCGLLLTSLAAGLHAAPYPATTYDEINDLISALDNEDPNSRAFTIMMLRGIIDDPRHHNHIDSKLLPKLIQDLTYPDPATRGIAAVALGYLGDPKAVRPLLDLLKDSAPEARGGAAAALGRLREAAALPLLLQMLKEDPDANARKNAARGLSFFKDQMADQLILTYLAQSDMDYHEIIQMGIPGSEEVLIRTLETIGNVQIATDFINSGNVELRAAGYGWAKRHGYQVVTGGGFPGVSWGR
jgi:hypothetical protein